MSPRTGAALYAAVMKLAGARCQCVTGQRGDCGTEHRSGLERCHSFGTRKAPLVAAPLDLFTSSERTAP